MNNELTIFEGIELEILTKEDVNIEFNGEVLFNGKQVAEILGYFKENYSRDINRHCDEDCIELITKDKLMSKKDKLMSKTALSLGQRGTYFINEDGVMDLICNSKNISNNKKDEFIEFLKNNNLIKHDRVLTNQRKEINFLDKLEQALSPFEITCKKQYKVLNYRIDCYIPQLNIAIEYDENGHSSYTYEQHEGRQKEIEKELGCKFIRVTDKESDEYNLGYIIKRIYEMDNNLCKDCGCNMELFEGAYVCSNCGCIKKYRPKYNVME